MIKFRLLSAFMFFACISNAQNYQSAVISVYVYKDLNEKSGKIYPKLGELAHDPEFKLDFLADTLEKFLFDGFWDGFPFKVLPREQVIKEVHYHEYQSHYFQKEDNPPVSLARNYKMFVLEQAEYEDHDVDELMSIFPLLNSLISVSLKFHIIHNDVNENIIEIKPEVKIHFWDYKKEDTHIVSKSEVYVSRIHDWNPITQNPNKEILLLEMYHSLNHLFGKMKEDKRKIIRKVEKKLLGS